MLIELLILKVKEIHTWFDLTSFKQFNFTDLCFSQTEDILVQVRTDCNRRVHSVCSLSFRFCPNSGFRFLRIPAEIRGYILMNKRGSRILHFRQGLHCWHYQLWTLCKVPDLCLRRSGWGLPHHCCCCCSSYCCCLIPRRFCSVLSSCRNKETMF